MNIVIIDYGAGNIKSIQFAFKRLGVNAILTKDKNTILSADRVIFPGVGEAGSAMQMLQQSQLDTIIPKLKQPVLGICLGMQLMCNHTEESNTSGLGIFDSNVKRFSSNVKVPQMGWNSIHNLKSKLFNGITDGNYMYSVHSFYAELSDEAISTSNYDRIYASALQKKNFYGVQFHPEKSSLKGELLLKNFLEL